MKKIYAILLSVLALAMTACSNTENLGETGYLTLDITAPKTKNNTRAIPDGYDPRQLYVEVVNAAGEIVVSTPDYSQWQGMKLTLKAGTYTINAHSNNWEGQDAGRDVPFYAGSTTAEVKVGMKTDAEIVCTLANVKVSVVFDETVRHAFKSTKVDVISAIEGVETQTFDIENTNSMKSAYFPAGRLTARLTVVNRADETYTMDKVFTDVKPRDHYILKYSTAGQGGFTITADDAQTTFTYNFSVPVHASTSLRANEANAWTTLAYVGGSVKLADADPELAKVSFLYKKAADSEWSTIAAEADGSDFKATIKNLEPNTAYSYKIAYTGEEETFESAEVAFTTEEAVQLPNSNMDAWYTGKVGNFNCPYPTTKDFVDEFGYSFWGTSNAGTALLNKSVTKEEKTDVHTEGGSSARLGSEYVVIKFAAASLFAGEFKELVGTSGGKIQFGRPFTTRPTQFKGWYKYSSGKMNRVGTLPSYLQGQITKNETDDTWSCWIALMTESFEYDNSTTAKASSKKYDANGTMPDFESDSRVIAYGEMPMSDCGAQSVWSQFTVDLKYRDLTRKPSYVAIVISSSRYGDFFTGYDKSTLLVDDLELIYGEPTMQE